MPVGLPGGDIYLYLPSGRIWHKVILMWGPRKNRDSRAASGQTLISFYWYLSDIPLRQNMVQGRFIMGAIHESRLMSGRCKNSWPRHFPFGLPHAPSNKLSPSSGQSLETKFTWRIITNRHECQVAAWGKMDWAFFPFTGNCRAPHIRASLAQGLILLGVPSAGLWLTHPRRFQKCLEPRWHSLKKGYFGRQAIKLATPKRVKTWGDGLLRLSLVGEI